MDTFFVKLLYLSQYKGRGHYHFSAQRFREPGKAPIRKRSTSERVYQPPFQSYWNNYWDCHSSNLKHIFVLGCHWGKFVELIYWYWTYLTNNLWDICIHIGGVSAPFGRRLGKCSFSGICTYIPEKVYFLQKKNRLCKTDIFHLTKFSPIVGTTYPITTK